jgi:hypothetical protein
MQRLNFSIDIKAPAQKVYESMLGLKDKSTYQQWTIPFNPTSSFEGDWSLGSTMRFVGVDENGKKGGMLSEIAEHEAAAKVAIRHIGFIAGDQEITSGPEIEPWIGAMEIYKFEEQNGITTVTVDLDMGEDYIDYFKETYPKALVQLKEYCERA